MSDDELDAAIAERFKAYEEWIRLPDGFKGRFVGSVRRKRTLRRTCVLGLICATIAVCATVVSLTKPVDASNDTHPSLTAKVADTNKTTDVSYLMLLGYLRECFSRCCSSRRKEDEQNDHDSCK